MGLAGDIRKHARPGRRADMGKEQEKKAMTLEEIREEIDAIDRQMKALFIKRMDCARQVAETKAKTGGDVYVAEREAAMIQKRTSGIEDRELRENYRDFLTHTICISRRYQYGILKKMQDEAARSLLDAAGLKEEIGHGAIRVSFCCGSQDEMTQGSALCRYMDIIALHHIGIREMHVTEADGQQEAVVLLKGNTGQEEMRRLLCQLSKEAKNFKIRSLEG